MAQNVNLQVFRKTTPSYLLRFTKNGIAKPITGWTIYFTAKVNISDSDDLAKIKYTITAHQDALGGKSLIQFTQADTDRIGSLHYDIDYKDDEGNVGVLYYGRINFKQKTTNRA